MDYPTFEVPLLLRILCFLGGMAVIIAETLWLRRYAGNRAGGRSLRVAVGLSLLRIFAATALISAIVMGLRGAWLDDPVQLLPELAIITGAALFYHAVPGRTAWHAMLVEYLAALGLMLACVAGWAFSIGIGWVFTRFLPADISIFLIGLIWNLPLAALYYKARRDCSAPVLQDLLWPLILAYGLLMVPDGIEYIANAPKFRAMLEATPPLGRA